LEYEETEPNFVCKELPKEVEESIQNPKIKSIRQKIVSAISELISKLNRMKERLVDIDTPPEKVKSLQELVDSTYKLFDSYCVIKQHSGFRIESGASLPNELRESAWPLFLKENEYWYQLYFFGQGTYSTFKDTLSNDEISVFLWMFLSFVTKSHWVSSL
jgi:DNA repair ATPase RecN